MAYAPHLKITCSGVFADGTDESTVYEIWATSIKASPQIAAPLSQTDLKTYVSEIGPPIEALFKGTATGVDAITDQGVYLQRVLAANIDSMGKVVPNSEFLDYSGAHSAAAISTIPPVNCLVCSFNSAKTRAPGKWSRMFLPDRSMCTTSTGWVVSTIADNVRDWGAAFLDAVANTSGTVQAIPVVASGVDATNSPIVEVRVGNRTDLVQRRHNAQSETYSSVAWTP